MVRITILVRWGVVLLAVMLLIYALIKADILFPPKYEISYHETNTPSFTEQREACVALCRGTGGYETDHQSLTFCEVPRKVLMEAYPNNGSITTYFNNFPPRYVGDTGPYRCYELGVLCSVNGSVLNKHTCSEVFKSHYPDSGTLSGERLDKRVKDMATIDYRNPKNISINHTTRSIINKCSQHCSACCQNISGSSKARTRRCNQQLQNATVTIDGVSRNCRKNNLTYCVCTT